MRLHNISWEFLLNNLQWGRKQVHWFLFSLLVSVKITYALSICGHIWIFVFYQYPLKDFIQTNYFYLNMLDIWILYNCLFIEMNSLNAVLCHSYLWTHLAVCYGVTTLCYYLVTHTHVRDLCCWLKKIITTESEPPMTFYLRVCFSESHACQPWLERSGDC